MSIKNTASKILNEIERYWDYAKKDVKDGIKDTEKDVAMVYKEIKILLKEFVHAAESFYRHHGYSNYLTDSEVKQLKQKGHTNSQIVAKNNAMAEQLRHITHEKAANMLVRKIIAETNRGKKCIVDFVDISDEQLLVKYFFPEILKLIDYIAIGRIKRQLTILNCSKNNLSLLNTMFQEQIQDFQIKEQE